MPGLRPSSQWITPAATSTGVTIRPLYLVETSADVWELDGAPPATGVPVETTTDVYEIDDDPAVAGALRIIQQAGNGDIYLTT